MLEADLRRQIDALWDKFWAGGLPNPLVAIDQVNLLLFLRRLEELDAQRAAQAERRGESFASVFSGGAEKNRWSWWSNLPATDMYEHLQREVIPWMRTLGGSGDVATRNLVREANLLIPTPSLLAEAVASIERLRITDRNVDTQGDIYEYMLLGLQTAGQLGQFRTPRHIIRAIVELVEPRLGDTVIDPACGTGGFLIGAHQHVLSAGTSPEFVTHDEIGTPQHLVGDRYSENQWAVLRNPPLVGYDVDAQLVRIATMNMILHSLHDPKIEYANALGKTFSHAPRADVVLANPPFSGKLDEADVSDEFRTRTRKTELLFLQLFSDLLVPGGRAGVIVPDSVLFSSQATTVGIRRRLLEENTVHAVVSLPQGVFRPYTDSSCGIIFFQKGGTTERVWMYDVRADGYSLDDRRQPVPENDLPDMLQAWRIREEGDRSVVVPLETIKNWNYDLTVDTYLPFEMPRLEYAMPEDAIEAAVQAAAQLERAIRQVNGES